MPPFKKINRIQKNYEFLKVYKEGKKIVGKYFIIFAKKRHNQKEISRLGLCVSKKISKKAVRRNRIKRLLRESFRQNEDIVQKGYDIIIVARSKIIGLDFHKLDKILWEALKEKLQ